MTPAQIDTASAAGFTEARIALNLSRRQLAQVLGMGANGYNTIEKWESGRGHGPNPVAATALLWFLEGFRPMNWPTDSEAAGYPES